MAVTVLSILGLSLPLKNLEPLLGDIHPVIKVQPPFYSRESRGSEIIYDNNNNNKNSQWILSIS